ncbi:MAG: DUF922 domain-containing protein [Litorimonas sp.]
MKHVRGFLFSLAFIALAWLAFNPQTVVKIQGALGISSETSVQKAIARPPIKPPVLPETATPDSDNLPRINTIESYARNDPWIGEAPCSVDVFDAPDRLPGLGPREIGPILDTPLSANDNYTIKDQPTFLYKSENGVTLKLVQPVFDYYEVSGRRFRDAQKDIFDRQPLRDLQRSETISSDTPARTTRTRSATLAFIHSPTSLTYMLTGSRDRYRLAPQQTVLTSAFLVTLPRWTSYETARPSDQARWDDLFCNAAHHELGHLRIRLDILAETLDGYASLPPAASYDEMETITVDYRKDIGDRVQKRQDAYHVYNGGGIRRGMIELPYADLPFPWLESSQAEGLDDVKTAEQLPAQQ